MGGTDDGACVSTRTLGGVWGHAPPEKFSKLGALRSLLRSYLYPNATSLTRVHAGSNTAVRHDAHQSSRGVSVTIVHLVRVRLDEVGILLMTWTRTVSTLHFETSSVITHSKSGHKGHHA